MYILRIALLIAVEVWHVLLSLPQQRENVEWYGVTKWQKPAIKVHYDLVIHPSHKVVVT